MKPLFTALMLFLSVTLFSQQQYEYATYQRMGTGRSLLFVTREKTEEINDSGKEEEIRQHILQRLTDLSKEGWEVYNVGVTGNWATYFLRRKI